LAEQWPVNEDNPFGQPDPVYRGLGYLGHPGIDFRCDVGTPITASAAGTVRYAGEAGSAGNMVDVQHVFGRTRYLHLSEIAVATGDAIAAGGLLGLSGSTGLSSGPHLHLDFYPHGELMNNGYGGRIDPLLFMRPS
jgi:murein DD-endopeptidase MepM/ murein hydrolase activator NlpD